MEEGEMIMKIFSMLRLSWQINERCEKSSNFTLEFYIL